MSSSLSSQRQRDQYFEEGAVIVEGAIPETWLKRLRAASDEILERSRSVAPHSKSRWSTVSSASLHRGHRREVREALGEHHPGHGPAAAAGPCPGARAGT